METQEQTVQAAVEPPKRKCQASEILGPSLLGLVKMAPENPIVRSHVLAAIKKPLPDDLITTNQIIDWIEFNFEKKVTRPAESTVICDIIAAGAENVSGTCRFVGSRSVKQAYAVTAADIYYVLDHNYPTVEHLRTATVEDIVSSLFQRIQSRLAEMDQDGDIDEPWIYRANTISDIETSEHHGVVFSFGEFRPNIRTYTIRFLNQHLPEVFQNLRPNH